MSKKKKVRYFNHKKLNVLKIFSYKEAEIIIQSYQFMFQFMMRYKGNWHQAYNIITPEKGQTRLTVEQVAQAVLMVQDQAIATVEQLIQNATPDFTPTPEQVAGQEVVDVLEQAKRMN